jgi:hypothetical protein
MIRVKISAGKSAITKRSQIILTLREHLGKAEFLVEFPLPSHIGMYLTELKKTRLESSRKPTSSQDRWTL